MSNVKQIITDNLIALRKSRNLTQQDVASYLNYTDKAVSRWETGESLPDISVLEKLADYYGVDFEYLIKTHDEPVKPVKLAAQSFAHVKVKNSPALLAPKVTVNRCVCVVACLRPVNRKIFGKPGVYQQLYAVVYRRF